MPKRDKFTHAALGFIAGTLLSLLLLVWAVPEFSSPIDEASVQSTEQLHSGSATKNERSNEPQWRYWTRRLVSAEDTLAQWVMAFFAVIATGITGVGIYLIWRTLEYTRIAADHAGQTVREARRATQVALLGAKEARRTVEQAEESNKLLAASYAAENRPWIVLDVALMGDIVLQPNGRVQFPISITFKNIGKTPAENLHILVQAKPYSEPGDTLEDFVRSNTRDGAIWREKILLPEEADVEVWPQYLSMTPPLKEKGSRSLFLASSSGLSTKRQ